jgi:hypothetical protein
MKGRLAAEEALGYSLRKPIGVSPRDSYLALLIGLIPFPCGEHLRRITYTFRTLFQG